MDKFLRKWIYKQYKIGAMQVSVLELLLFICITGTSVFLRRSVVEYTPFTEGKVAAMAADYVMALLAAAFIWGRTNSRNRTLLTYALLVIWPIFIANSALWGRSCSFCGALLVLALLCYDRNIKSVSLIALIGALVIFGSGLQQPADGDLLTLGWPNIFELTGKIMFIDLYAKVSFLFILGILLCVGYCMIKMKIRMTKQLFLPFLLFFAVFLPYFAPFMPAWAGYSADVLVLLFVILKPKKFYLALLHLIVSYSAYAYVLNEETKLPMVTYSVILLVILLDLGAYVYEGMKAQGIDG